ncbi:MAG: c-type cytochrome, partial [Nitrospirota bacterium]|nr:c-type cytochrome [Nitrospirota bacterium]
MEKMRKFISRYIYALCPIILTAAIFSAYPSTGSAAQNSGKKTYERYCAACHGTNGDGRGPAYGGVYPPPRDFTLGLFKWKSTPFDELSPSLDD